MKTSVAFTTRILQKLSCSYSRFCTFEELTEYILSDSNVSTTLSEHISSQRTNQAKILETLIMLDYEGYIFLNPTSDESSITIKGLIKINNKILYN